MPPGKPIYVKTLGRLIGNAVPVKLGEAIGKSILSAHPIALGRRSESGLMNSQSQAKSTEPAADGICARARAARRGTSPSVDRGGYRSIEWPHRDPRPPQHRITLSSIDEDSLGEKIEVIWEIEPGAHIIERAGLPSVTGRDETVRSKRFSMPFAGERRLTPIAVSCRHHSVAVSASRTFSSIRWCVPST